MTPSLKEFHYFNKKIKKEQLIIQNNPLIYYKNEGKEMQKNQPRQDVEKAIDSIILNNNEKFEKFMKFKNEEKKTFSNITCTLLIILAVNFFIICLDINYKVIVPIMFASTLMYFILLVGFFTTTPSEYKDVYKMFHKENVIKALNNLGVEYTGMISYIDIDLTVIKKIEPYIINK